LGEPLKVSFSTLSQGSAGDVAMSDPVTMTVNIAAEADGVTVTTLDNVGIGVEDSQTGVKIPARIARDDKSESLSEVEVTATTSGTVDDVVYLTRFEMLKTGVTDLSSVTDLYDVKDLEVKGDGTYEIASGAQSFDVSDLVSSGGKAALRVQIAGDVGKTIPDVGSMTSVAAIEAALTSAGFTRGTDYIYVLEGAYGNRKIVGAVDWEDSSLSAQTNHDLTAKFLKEGTLSHDLSDYVTKDGDVFTVNVEGWLASKNLTENESWLNANVMRGSDASAKNNFVGEWLANNLGVETAANVSGNVGIYISYTTKT
jgi:hypothetical protein